MIERRSKRMIEPRTIEPVSSSMHARSGDRILPGSPRVQGMNEPPLTSMTAPVMKEEPSPERNKTTEAISPGSP